MRIRIHCSIDKNRFKVALSRMTAARFEKFSLIFFKYVNIAMFTFETILDIFFSVYCLYRTEGNSIHG